MDQEVTQNAIGTVSAMGTAYLVAGCVLVVFVMHDVIKTTLGVRGGYITTWLSSILWRAATRLSRYGRHTMLYIAGIAAVSLIVVIWMGVLWLGWTFIFAGARETILVDGWPATLAQRAQHAGYAMVTLGTPEGFEPGTGAGRVATVLAAANGFGVLTLGIAYVTPLVAAATDKRQLALYISSLGESANEILKNAYECEDLHGFEAHLQQLTPMLTLLAQRYLAYPALHYFHSTNRSSAATPSLAALDEALTLVSAGCQGDDGPDPFTVGATRHAVSAILSTLKSAYVQPADEVPPLPPLDDLQRIGVNTVSAADYKEAMEEHEERRRLLLALVKSDGWDWNDVHVQPDDPDDDQEPMTEVQAREVHVR